MPRGLYRFHHSGTAHFITFTCHHRYAHLADPTVPDVLRALLGTHRLGRDNCRENSPQGGGIGQPSTSAAVSARVLGNVGKIWSPPGTAEFSHAGALITTQRVLRPFATRPPPVKQRNVRQGISVSAPSAPRLRITPGSLTIPKTRFSQGYLGRFTACYEARIAVILV